MRRIQYLTFRIGYTLNLATPPAVSVTNEKDTAEIPPPPMSENGSGHRLPQAFKSQRKKNKAEGVPSAVELQKRDGRGKEIPPAV
jgi:hypothetical protein